MTAGILVADQARLACDKEVGQKIQDRGQQRESGQFPAIPDAPEGQTGYDLCRPQDTARRTGRQTSLHHATETDPELQDATFICDVCMADVPTLEVRPCCRVKICPGCFEEYLENRVLTGARRIECVSCERPIPAHVVLRVLSRGQRIRSRDEFSRLLRGDKKCPRCQVVLGKFEGSGCPQCGLSWCFRCEATHEGVACEAFSAQHRDQIRSWAKSVSGGQWNAQKCPRCKVYIQRASGCDHMHCAHCQTHFCYRCGGRLRHFKFFGDHYSKLSVFGCKYKYKPDKPVQRRLVRGAVFMARVVAIPLAGAGALCGVALLALFALPMYAGYRVHRNVSSRKASKDDSGDATSISSEQTTASSSS